MRFEITIGEDTVTKDLAEKLKVSYNPRKALQAAALAFGSVALRSFNDPSLRQADWAPLKKATLARKKKLGQSPNILQATGLLKTSVSSMAQIYTDTSVTVGVSVPYAVYHQTGTQKMPRRPIFPIDENGELTPQAADLMWEAIKKSLDKEFQVQGFRHD